MQSTSELGWLTETLALYRNFPHQVNVALCEPMTDGLNNIVLLPSCLPVCIHIRTLIGIG